MFINHGLVMEDRGLVGSKYSTFIEDIERPTFSIVLGGMEFYMKFE